MKSITVMVSRNCNFQCRYCFENHTNGQLSEKNAKRIIDAALWHKVNNISLFGGEPLLNWDTIVYMVNYANTVSDSFRFTITTNGYLLDSSKLAFISKNRINLAISFDGESHNGKRILANGKDTTKTVLDNIAMAVKLNCHPTICPVITSDSIVGISTDYIKIYEMGVKRILPALDEKSFDWTDEHFILLKNEYEIVCNYCIEQLKNKKRIDFCDFYFLFCTKSSSEGIICKDCSLGDDDLVVDVNGDIYPCIQFLDSPSNVVGNIFTGIDNNAVTQMKRMFNVPQFDDCLSCEHVTYCQSRCACRNYVSKKGWNTRPNCDLVKLKLSIFEKYSAMFK